MQLTRVEESEDPVTLVDTGQQYSFLDLFQTKDNMRTRTLIGLGLVLFQQFTGQPNVLFYASTIFHSVGFQSTASAVLASVGLGIVKVVATLVAMSCADKVGRRALLIGGCIVMSVSVTAIGLLSQHALLHVKKTCDAADHFKSNLSSKTSLSDPTSLNTSFYPIMNLSINSFKWMSSSENISSLSLGSPDGSQPHAVPPSALLEAQVEPVTLKHGIAGDHGVLNWITLLSMMAFVSAYSVGFGPMTWLVLSEIFPAGLRGRAFAFTNCFNWAANLIVTLTFLDVIGSSDCRRLDARCTHLDARRFGASTLGARTSTLDASALRRSVHIHRRSALDAWCLDASTLGARTSTLDASALRRSVHAPRRSTLRRFDARCTHLDARRFGASTLGARTSTLDASALRRSVHAPRRSTLRRFDARCTHLDARRFGARRLAHRRLDARCTHLDARRFGASTLGARTSTLDASALRRSVHAPRRSTLRRFDARCTHLDARRFGASTLGARTSTLDASALRRSVHAPRRSTLRRSTLGASTPRRSVHAPRRSTLRRFDARCTHLDARRFGASTLGVRTSTLRRSTLGASTLSVRTTMSGFHRCVTCQAKLPASDPHDDCVSCLGPDHAASALADRAYCQLCAGFQTRTLRQRARKAVGGRSPSSGSSHTISAPPSSAFTPPVAAQPPRSPSSQLTAGQRSPARRTRERSRSPSSRGARPRRESRSRSRSPRRRRYSRSPRRGRRHQETSGVAELTSKMSQFMEVMMGQQSLLMTLANVVPRAPELPTGPVAGQPVVPPPVPHGQPQEVWDVDAVSRDASDAEPLFEEGTEPEATTGAPVAQGTAAAAGAITGQYDRPFGCISARPTCVLFTVVQQPQTGAAVLSLGHRDVVRHGTRGILLPLSLPLLSYGVVQINVGPNR
ncbi:UNVERIFIED_CONTAM: hypothetical protein FKN15_050064 [Acipenser sinensis]